MDYDQLRSMHNITNMPGYMGNKKKPVRNEAILIGLDQVTWGKQLDSVAQWLGNTLMAQTAFHHLVQDTINKIQEPHIRRSLEEISVIAGNHIRKAEELFDIIHRDPHYFSQLGGVAIAEFKETIGSIKGMLGGAGGDWQMLHQLVLSNMNSLSAFAVVEQFGLLLGLPEIVNVTINVVHQKQTHELLLKEYMLEMASISIIYKKSM